MDYAYLGVKIQTTKGTIIGQHKYWYKVPIYVPNGNGDPVLITKAQARSIFLTDPDRHKKLLAELPTDGGCIAYVKLGDLQIPVPNTFSSVVSVLRVNHTVSVGESVTILAELKDWGVSDKAFVEIIPQGATVWTTLGRYPMQAEVAEFPANSGAFYGWKKVFGPLSTGDRVEYRVYANDQTAYLAGIISVDNTNPVNGPVWGSWTPKIVQVGTGYGETLPANAATGTGTIVYELISAPSWYTFAGNTRTIVGTPPGSIPSGEQKVVFRATDSNGFTDKSFTLQFGAVLDMVMGWGFENVPGGSKTYLGIGPNDDLPYTTKLTALSGASGFTDNGVKTAERIVIGLNGVNYPWRSVYDNLPVGVYLVEAVRSNGQKRYALIVHTGLQSAWTLDLSSSPIPYDPAAINASIDGDDFWLNIGANDGSLNDGVLPEEKVLYSLTPTGPASVLEGSQIQLGLTAQYTDGSTVNVITQATVTVTSGSGVSLNSSTGILTASTNASTGDTHDVILSFSFGSQTILKTITILDATVVATVSSLAINGPASSPEGMSPKYTMIATYSDGSTADVTVSAIKNGGTNGTMLQDGTLQIPANNLLDDSRQTTITASFGGKNASKTIDITDATVLSIASVFVGVQSGNTLHYVKTSPITRASSPGPIRQLYYRIKTAGGGIYDSGYSDWNALYTLLDHTDTSGAYRSSSLLALSYNHYLYGTYYGGSGSAYTVTLQIATSATGTGAVEVAYAMPASAGNPTIAPLQVYPPVS